MLIEKCAWRKSDGLGSYQENIASELSIVLWIVV